MKSEKFYAYSKHLFPLNIYVENVSGILAQRQRALSSVDVLEKAVVLGQMTELSLSFSGSTSLLQRGCCLIYVRDKYSCIFIADTKLFTCCFGKY